MVAAEGPSGSVRATYQLTWRGAMRQVCEGH